MIANFEIEYMCIENPLKYRKFTNLDGRASHYCLVMKNLPVISIE